MTAWLLVHKVNKQPTPSPSPKDLQLLTLIFNVWGKEIFHLVNGSTIFVSRWHKMGVFVPRKMTFVVIWIERGCKQAEVHAVAIVLQGVLQLSQLLDDIFLMKIFPQSPTLNQALVMSSYSPGEGQLWCQGLRATRPRWGIVLSPNRITLWKQTQIIPNNMLIASQT